ncbi:MAG: alkyl sulfatase dimerization domain-containing protein [Actinomycetota bacterium]
MADLLDLSARIIDTGDLTTPTNRVTGELSELGEGLAIVESFSHVWAVDTGDGLVLVDTSHVLSGQGALDAIRSWRTDRVHSMVYTHGHIDHVGGSGAIVAEAVANGHATPDVIAHEAVHDRFERYRETAGWNLTINARQFGGNVKRTEVIGATPDSFLPDDVAAPTVTHEDGMTTVIGDTTFEMHHADGETDDHTWIWDPDRKAVYVGDLFMWNFPNAGNPQKVQRFAGDWADALRAMIAKEPELMLPAHGLPVGGRDRVAEVLDTAASALEYLVRETVALMNEGATLDTILHTVTLPSRFEGLPYLVPNYDEPGFVVRNIYRLYGGWWDGDPSNLHPAPKSALGAEVAALAGGAEALARRALELVEAGELDLAGHLAQMAVDAEPANPAVHESRIEVFAARRAVATSLMSRGIYKSVINASKDAIADAEG